MAVRVSPQRFQQGGSIQYIQYIQPFQGSLLQYLRCHRFRGESLNFPFQDKSDQIPAARIHRGIRHLESSARCPLHWKHYFIPVPNGR